MRSDRRQTILFVIILLILSMGIGYAFLTTTLSIDGVSDIDSAVWDVHWENVIELSGLPDEQVITPATIGNNGSSVNYSIQLKPGDAYYFHVDMANDGTLDAVIDDINLTINNVEDAIPPYLDLLILYSSYEEIEVGQRLSSGNSRTVLFVIHYKTDLSIEDLPSTAQTLNVSYEITFSQTHIPSFNNSYVYTTRFTNNIGQPLSDLSMYYNDYQSALDSFGHNTFIRHYMVNNLISTSEVGFVVNNNVYYLKGGDSGTSFNSNCAVLQSVFASEYCEYLSSYCGCETSNYLIYVYASGKVTFMDIDRFGCEVDSNGTSGCDHFVGS